MGEAIPPSIGGVVVKSWFLAIKYGLRSVPNQKGDAVMGDKDKGKKEDRKKPKLNTKEKKKLKQEKKKNK